MDKDIAFGSVEHTQIIDDNGSTATQLTKLAHNAKTGPVRIRYEIRHRTDKTDLDKLKEIAEGLLADFSKLDAELRLERTKTGEQEGYYNLVECYTVLKY